MVIYFRVFVSLEAHIASIEKLEKSAPKDITSHPEE